MADVHLLGHAIVVAVLVVVGLQVFVRDADSRFDLCAVEHDIPDFALFRNRVVVGRLVALVEGLQLGFIGIDLLQQIIFPENGVVELDLGVLLGKFLAHIIVRDQRAACDQVAKLIQQDLVP